MINEEEENNNKRWWIILGVILMAIIIIITLGWFFQKEQEKRVIEEKEKRLKEVEEKIKKLEAQKEKIERREKWIFFWIRFGIGVLLISLNCFNSFYWHDKFILGETLNFNWAILMGYSFFAYITFGTIANFTKELKSKLISLLRKNHINSLEELELLIKEREVLKTDIEGLNKSKL